MAEEQSVLDVRVEAAQALSSLQSLARVTRDYAKSNIESASDLRRAESALAQWDAKITKAQTAITRLSTTVKEQRQLIQSLSQALVASYKERDRLVAIIAKQEQVERTANATSREGAATAKNRTAATNNETAAIDKNTQAKLRNAKTPVAMASAMQSSLGITAASGGAIGLNSKTAANARLAAESSLGTSLQGFNAIRYALYDISSVTEQTGRAILNTSKAVVQTSVDWERAFANVRRTVGGGAEEMEEIYEGLVDLTRKIPIAFGDITEIAALGGQLGIAASGIDNFTSVVARLTATTNLSQEAAGTALGRFQAILGISDDQFENLASSILKVGVNSVATETQIVRIATQLSAVGDYAGMSYHEIIGLSGALASVGAPPELSRGTFTRLFAQMNAAVANGGAKLEEFGRVSGISGQQFREAWGKPGFGDVLQKFLHGLQAEGVDATRALADLGITSVRDVPLLQRLSKASQTLTNAFADAKSGAEENIALSEQYGYISSTTASRLQVLINAVQELAATVGGAANGPIKNFVNFLIDAVNTLTDMASNPFWSTMSQTAVIVGLVGGALLTLAGMGMRALATMLALTTVLSGSGAAAGGAAASTTAMNVAILGTPAVAGRAAAALRVFGAAIKAIPFVAAISGIAILASTVSDGFQNMAEQGQGWVDSFAGQLKKFKDLSGQGDDPFGALAGMTGANVFNQAFNPLATLETIKAGFDDLAYGINTGDWELAFGGEQGRAIKSMRDQINQTFLGGDFEKAIAMQGELNRAMGMGPAEVNKQEKAMREMLATLFPVEVQTQAAEKAAADYEARMESLAALLGFESTEAFNALADSIAGVASELSAQSIFDTLTDEAKAFAEAQADATASSSDSWEDYAGNMEWSLLQVTERLRTDMANIAAFQNNLVQLVALGATDLVSALSSMDPATGARLAAEALTFDADTLASVNASWAEAAERNTGEYAARILERVPAMQAVMAQAGRESLAAFNAALAEGKSLLQATADGLGITITPTVIPDPNAASSLLAFTDQGGRTLMLDASLDEEELTQRLLTWTGKTAEEAGESPVTVPLDTDKLTEEMTDWINSVVLPSLQVRIEPIWKGGTSFQYRDPYANVSNPLAQADGGMYNGQRFVREAPSFASGGGWGQFKGPGSGTSDSIWARVSNGEFINTAASVRHWGVDVFDDLNRRRFPSAFAPLVAAAGGNQGPANVTNVEINQFNPVVRDSIKDAREVSEKIAEGLWS